MRNPLTPLSPRAEEALDRLERPITSRANGLPRPKAHAELRQCGFEADLAKSVLNQLLQKGYLYEVDGDLYVT